MLETKEAKDEAKEFKLNTMRRIEFCVLSIFSLNHRFIRLFSNDTVEYSWHLLNNANYAFGLFSHIEYNFISIHVGIENVSNFHR